jgi:hypothetical protein
MTFRAVRAQDPRDAASPGKIRGRRRPGNRS